MNPQMDTNKKMIVLTIKELTPMVEKFFEEKECFPMSYVEAKPHKEGRFDCYYKFRCSLPEMSITVDALSGVDIYSGRCMHHHGTAEIKSLSDFLQGEWICNQN